MSTSASASARGKKRKREFRCMACHEEGVTGASAVCTQHSGFAEAMHCTGKSYWSRVLGRLPAWAHEEVTPRGTQWLPCGSSGGAYCLSVASGGDGSRIHHYFGSEDAIRTFAPFIETGGVRIGDRNDDDPAKRTCAFHFGVGCDEEKMLRRWSCCPARTVLGPFRALLTIVHGPHIDRDEWTAEVLRVLCAVSSLSTSLAELILRY